VEIAGGGERGGGELGVFFDGVYVRAAGDDTAVPWQSAASRDAVARWLTTLDHRHHRRALVVAAGLGDDAAALARLGLEVIAFDQSPTAVAWAAERHPDVAVTWLVADLFDPPATWIDGFDLVLEVFTIQSIPPEEQRRAMTAVRDFVAPGGLLVVVALLRSPDAEPAGPPWPLDPSTLSLLEAPDEHRPPLQPTGGERIDLAPNLQLVRRDLRRPTTTPPPS
jgi:Methyltransferase domain